MDLEQQLRAALAPARPEPQVRAAVMARLAADPGRRVANRWVLMGAVLALGAAAAMLAIRLLEPDTSAIVDSSHVPAVQPIGTNDPPVPLDTATTQALPEIQRKEPQPVAPGINPFTVQMLPVKSDVEDAARKAAIEAVHAALVDGLRAVPGLKLLEPATPGSEAPVSANYSLALEGKAAYASATFKGDFSVNLVAQRLAPDGRMLGNFYTGTAGEIAPGCATPASMDLLASDSSCADPAGVAGRLLATLRKMVFPPDPQLQRQLQARLVDQALGADERLRALVDLGSLGRASGAIVRDAFPAGLREPAMVRAAIQLASTTQDPAVRAQVWYTLRGSGDPELVRPLVTALHTDADDDTRVQALATLSADFAAEPRAQAALETAARGDSDPLVRALAQRALGAESVWTEYVLASLEDAGRSPVERVEALFYAYGLPTSRMYGSFAADGRILRALDDAAMRALTEVLPKAAADSPRYANASLTLVSQITFMNHPAITDMLLESLSAGDAWPGRRIAVEALRRRADDPRVRAALAKVAAEDADPQIRELAGKPSVATERPVAATGGPPRLGVTTEYVKAAPGVSDELVGKLAVVHMGLGSAAEKAGMKEADVLLEIDGKPISSGPQLIEVLDGLPRDFGVDVLVSRGGQTVRLTARF